MSQLPGRTDNEIKNYWNTRIKRRQRAGLPVYPPNLSFSASNENQLGQSVGDFSSIEKMQNEVLRGNGYDIPDIIFDDFKLTSDAPPFTAIPVSNMLYQGFGSQGYGTFNHPLDYKRLRENENLFPLYPAVMDNGLPVFENFSSDQSENINLTLAASYPYDPDPLRNLAPYDGANPGSHAVMNGNYSTSGPLQGTVKPELPSLQYTETDPSCWFSCASSPPSEAIDTYIQSPPTVSVQSECSSPRNSGLLEEVLHESHLMHNGKKLSSDKSSNSSVMTPSDLVASSANNFRDGTSWEECDPSSPLGCSAASVFNEYTPPFSGSSLDDLPLSGGPSGEHATCGSSISINFVHHIR